MRMKQKRKQLGVSLSVILMLSVLLWAASCSPARRPGPVEPGPTPTPSPTQPSPGGRTTPDLPNEKTSRAQELARAISDLENIHSATVVLYSNSAWVGVDLAAGSENKLTNEMKNRITSLVKREEKGIDRVYVVADADSVSRLKEIAREVERGKPITGFLEELNEIGRRITPSSQ
jgi:YhcN/YlaJ family sporulation lipoprotein